MNARERRHWQEWRKAGGRGLSGVQAAVEYHGRWYYEDPDRPEASPASIWLWGVLRGQWVAREDIAEADWKAFVLRKFELKCRLCGKDVQRSKDGVFELLDAARERGLVEIPLRVLD